MAKNPLLKKSKTYYKNLLSFVGISVLTAGLLTVVVFMLLNVITVRDSVQNAIFCVLGLLIPIVTTAAEKLSDSFPWETYLSYLRRKGIVRDSDLIRTSYAGFLLVEVDGEYLLLKNSHGIELYQLPSMTYPVSAEEEAKLKTEFDAKDDDYITDKDYDDYRMLVPAKNLKPFYRRFCQTVNPQSDCYPIVKILTKRCGLNEELFRNCRIEFRKRIVPHIAYSSYTGHFEMLVRDVCLFILSEEQKRALKEIKNRQGKDFIFASIERIKSNGVDKANRKLHADIAPFVYGCIMPDEDS